MRRCTTCGTAYDESVEECPRDGTPLFAMESEFYEDDLAEDTDPSVGIPPSSRETESAPDEDDAIDKALVEDPEIEEVGDPTVVIPQLDQETIETQTQEPHEKLDPLEEREHRVPENSVSRAAEPPPAPMDDEQQPRKNRERIAQTQMGAPAIMNDSLDENSDPYPLSLSHTPPPPPPDTASTPSSSERSEPDIPTAESAQDTPYEPEVSSFEEFSEAPLAETRPDTEPHSVSEPLEPDELTAGVPGPNEQDSEPQEDPINPLLVLTIVFIFAATAALIIFDIL